MSEQIAVIGATGNAGRALCDLIAREHRFRLLACARSQVELIKLENRLLSLYPMQVVDTVTLSVQENAREFSRYLAGSDIVVGATSRVEHAPVLADAALRIGASYLGIYLSRPKKWTALHRLTADRSPIRTSIVDDAGAHPGLPGVMIRYMLASRPLTAAWIGARFSLQWSKLNLTRETVVDFLEEIRGTDMSIYENEIWKLGMRHSRSFDFGSGIGRHTCMPTCMEEIRERVRMGEGLRSVGFFISGFGPAVDYGIFPLSIALATLSRNAAGRFLAWGLRTFESNETYAVLVLEGNVDTADPFRLRVAHPDPYMLTAAPTFATLLQLIDRPRPGVWTQASFVDPVRFFGDLRRLGVDIEESPM